ncbi:MAG: YceI family protein [Pseudomonadota bacterium]
MLRSMACGVLLAATLLQPAFAKTNWVVDWAASNVGFEYEKDGAPTEGVFREFTGSGSFDPATPDAARFEIRIKSASIDLHNFLASGFATSAEWFDSKNHPDVVYVLTDLKPLGEGRYAASGSISIRGRTKRLNSEIALTIYESDARASGVLTIRRTDFLLGVGPSAALVEIGPDVLVRFSLVARPEG